MKKKYKILSILIPLCVPVLLFLIFTVSAEGFGVDSIMIILNQSLIPLILSFGIVLISSTGLFDLSLGSQMVAVAIIAVRMSAIMGIAGLLIGSIVGGILFAVFVGSAYRILKIPSIILSIGMIFIIEYFGRLMCQTETMALFVDADISFIGAQPYSYIFAGIAIVLFYLIFNFTSFGYHIQLVGNNEITAAQLGVNVKRVKFLAFVVSGLFVGIAAILQSCYAGSISYMEKMASVALVFRPLMAVMIALGLNRFFNNIAFNLFVAVVSLNIIFNGLIALGLPGSTQEIALGLFLLIIMSITENTDRVKELKRRKQVQKQVINKS